MINGKVYIGQTSASAIERFDSHCNVAFKDLKNFKISKALRKYGKENFKVETLKICETKEELNFFEKEFIKQFKSTDIRFGYNMTPGGEGGNTYLTKTEDELKEIKQKISIANSGGNNGNAHSFYMKDINTNEIKKFGSYTEASKYFVNLGFDLKTDRVGERNLDEVKSFEFQTVFLDKYIFSETENFSIYTFSKPKGGAYRFLVKKDNENIFCTNCSTELYAYLGTSNLNKAIKNKKIKIIRYGGRGTNEKLRIME